MKIKDRVHGSVPREELINGFNPHKTLKSTRLQILTAEKLWSIVTQATETPHTPHTALESGSISATHLKAVYYTLCLTGFIVTCSTSRAEGWPGSHESTTSISTSSTVTRWTDFHPSDLNEPPGNRDLNH